MQTHYPFAPCPLPYDYISLLPYCDPDTLYLHHKNLYCHYVDMLNYLLTSFPQYQNWTLEELIEDPLTIPTTQERLIKNFAGAVYNHEFYFNGLCSRRTVPQGKLLKVLNERYGSIDNFQQLFSQAAHNVLGSGWVWLNSDQNGSVHIAITPDNKSPALRSITPVFAADVWEHSYYLRYPANRGDYITAWFATLNWEKAEQHFLSSLNDSQ